MIRVRAAAPKAGRADQQLVACPLLERVVCSVALSLPGLDACLRERGVQPLDAGPVDELPPGAHVLGALVLRVHNDSYKCERRAQTELHGLGAIE